jgi:predicted membrane-bound spermidine synthase
MKLNILHASGVASEYLLRPDSRLLPLLDKTEFLLRAGSPNKSFLSYLTTATRSLMLRAHKLKPLYIKQTPFQTIVLAKFMSRIALFQDGEWQFLSGKDAEGEFHKHEARIPALLVDNDEPQVLIIGGGDGLAAREVLRVKPNAKITLVDIDKDMIHFAATNPIMRRLNGDSIRKIKTVAADGINFMLNPKLRDKFDLVIVDLPDPIRDTTQHLYDEPLITGIINVVSPDGVVSIYSTAHNSPLQEWIAEELKKYFIKVWKVPARVYQMGIAGFVWAKYKKPEAEKFLDKYLLSIRKRYKAISKSVENMIKFNSAILYRQHSQNHLMKNRRGEQHG